MGEVIQRSFGNQINFDDDTDPVVRRLRLYSHSPHNWYAGLYDAAKMFNRPRDYVMMLFQIADEADPEANVPGTPAHAHAEWMKSIRYDPETYEIFDHGDSEKVQELGSETHAAARETLDGSEGSNHQPPTNVVPFPASGRR